MTKFNTIIDMNLVTLVVLLKSDLRLAYTMTKIALSLWGLKKQKNNIYHPIVTLEIGG
jgi:hypothetical protein